MKIQNSEFDMLFNKELHGVLVGCISKDMSDVYVLLNPVCDTFNDVSDAQKFLFTKIIKKPMDQFIHITIDKCNLDGISRCCDTKFTGKYSELYDTTLSNIRRMIDDNTISFNNNTISYYNGYNVISTNMIPDFITI